MTAGRHPRCRIWSWSPSSRRRACQSHPRSPAANGGGSVLRRDDGPPGGVAAHQVDRYHGGPWRRDRLEVRCPDRHRGTITELLWKVLKVRDAVPGDRTIRAALALDPFSIAQDSDLPSTINRGDGAIINDRRTGGLAAMGAQELSEDTKQRRLTQTVFSPHSP